MDSETTWGLYGSAGKDDLERLFDRLKDVASATASPSRPINFQFFDTFDWRLFRRRWALVRENDTYRLLDRQTGDLLAEEVVTATSAPRFAWAFGPGPLRQLLAPVIEVRALLQLVAVQGLLQTHEAVHPKSGNSWCLEHRRLDLALKGGHRFLMETISPRPLDGDDRGGKWLIRVIRESGLDPIPPTLLEPALSRAGIRPGAYSSKIRVPLEPDLSAREAAVQIAQHLLKTMKANLAGVNQDIDTEFLHDFRVAARRTRSLLALMKDVLPPDLRRAAKARFGRVGELTGPLRDLDVYLLRYPEYLELLPQEFHLGLKEIFTLAARRRAAVRRQMEVGLRDHELQTILSEWDQLLAEGPADWENPTGKGRQPIGILANRMIAKKYRRVLKLGAIEGGDISDADLHRLRIEGKKMRYALEFFASLYSGKTLDRLLPTLKKLQDHLGDHHDLVVQLADLRSLLQLKGPQALSPAAAAAAGALVLRLTERQQDLRAQFTKTFRGFAGPKIAAAMKKLVGPGC